MVKQLVARHKVAAVALVATVILAALVLAVFLQKEQGGELRLGQIGHLFSNLPACNGTNSLLTAAPVAEGDYTALIPLGNLNPPDHTIPTDHMYYVFKRDLSNRSAPAKTQPSLRADVFSPGLVHVTSLSKITTYKSGQIFTDDYQIDFYPCQDINLRYDHLTGLADKLTAAISSKSGDCRESHPRPEDTYRYCRYDLDVVFSPGEKVGVGGGGLASGIDLGAIDDRHRYGSFANPNRYSERDLHIACALDLFSGSLKDLLYSHLGNGTTQRTIEPRCGTIYQDLSGSLQGNWFYGETKADCPECWSKSLALVHDNIDPTIAVISIGGTFASAGKVEFTPTHTGLTNREFSEIKDSSIYCYQSDFSRGFLSSPAERYLIQLTTPTKIKIEKQVGNCSGSYTFAQPYDYQR